VATMDEQKTKKEMGGGMAGISKETGSKTCSTCGWWARSYNGETKQHTWLNQCAGRRQLIAPFALMACNADDTCEHWEQRQSK